MNFKNIIFDEKKEIFDNIHNYIARIIATEDWYSLEECTIEIMQLIGFEVNENEKKLLLDSLDMRINELMKEAEANNPKPHDSN